MSVQQRSHFCLQDSWLGLLQAIFHHNFGYFCSSGLLKAIDTVGYGVLLKKLHRLGFSKSFLLWHSSYLTVRKQFAQINDKISQEADMFWYPSRIHNWSSTLQLNDISDGVNQVTYQYADDAENPPKLIVAGITTISHGSHVI